MTHLEKSWSEYIAANPIFHVYTEASTLRARAAFMAGYEAAFSIPDHRKCETCKLNEDNSDKNESCPVFVASETECLSGCELWKPL